MAFRRSKRVSISGREHPRASPIERFGAWIGVVGIAVGAFGVWATFRVADKVEELERPAAVVAGIVQGASPLIETHEDGGRSVQGSRIQVVRLTNTGRSTATLLPAEAEDWAAFNPATGDLVRWADIVLPGGESRYVVFNTDVLQTQMRLVDLAGDVVGVEKLRNQTAAEKAVVDTLISQCVGGVAMCKDVRPGRPKG